MFRGRITRVRMDAEGPTTADVDRVLDEGFGVIHHGLIQAVEAGALRSDEGPLVFPRESRFGENVIESKVRDESGAVYHVGRRVVHFEEPDPSLGMVFVPADYVADLLDELDRDCTVARSNPPSENLIRMRNLLREMIG